MKDSFYFPHDYNAANDQKILRLRSRFNNAEGYGIYFMVLEAMAQENNGILDDDCIAQLSFSYRLSSELLESVVNYCIDIGLFIKDKKGIYSKRIIKYKKFRKERSESGKRGADSRWKNSSAINQPYAKERKGKERKGNKTVTNLRISEMKSQFLSETKK